MSNLFTNLYALEIVEFEKDVVSPAALPAYGLAPPVRSYRFFGPSGTPTPNENAGTTPELARLDFGSNRVDTVWVRRGDEDSVYTTKLGDSLRLPQAAYELRDRQIWSFSLTNLLSITIHYQGESQTIDRKSNGILALAVGSQGIIPEVEALRETLRQLSELRAVEWVAQGKDRLATYGLAQSEEKHRIVLKVQEGDSSRKLGLDFGKMGTDYCPYAAVELDGQVLVFKFPVVLYHGYVQKYLTLPKKEHDDQP